MAGIDPIHPCPETVGSHPLDRFHALFERLADQCPIRHGTDNDGGRCRLLLCTQGEAMVYFSGGDWRAEVLLSAASCCMLHLPGRLRCTNTIVHGGLQLIELTCPTAALIHAAHGTPVGRRLAAAARPCPLVVLQPMDAALHAIMEALLIAEDRAPATGHSANGAGISANGVPAQTRKGIEKARAVLERRMDAPLVTPSLFSALLQPEDRRDNYR